MNHQQPELESLLLTVTSNMLDQAKNGDWQTVTELEESRQKLIAAIFKDPSAQIDPDSEFGQIIQEIIQMDSEIQGLASDAKIKVQDGLIELNKTRSQAKAYQGK